jgi:hypothetical protein
MWPEMLFEASPRVDLVASGVTSLAQYGVGADDGSGLKCLFDYVLVAVCHREDEQGEFVVIELQLKHQRCLGDRRGNADKRKPFTTDIEFRDESHTGWLRGEKQKRVPGNTEAVR